jgi:hypothetical protein
MSTDWFTVAFKGLNEEQRRMVCQRFNEAAQISDRVNVFDELDKLCLRLKDAHSTDELDDKVYEAVALERAKVYRWLLRMDKEASSRHNYFEYAALVLKREWDKKEFDQMLDKMVYYPSYHDTEGEPS